MSNKITASLYKEHKVQGFLNPYDFAPLFSRSIRT